MHDIQRTGFGLALLLAVLASPMAVSAPVDAPIVFEHEPNDTPRKAPVVHGPVRLYGELPANDQDGYLWQVSDTDATGLWTLTLAGVPAGLTSAQIFRLHWSDNGQQVTKAEKLYALEVRNAATPVSSPPLLLEPGQYFLGVTRAGGPSAAAGEKAANAYRLALSSGRRVKAKTVPANSAEKPLNLRPGGSANHYTTQADSWVRLTVSPQQAEGTISLQGGTVLGKTLTISVLDAQDQPLAQAKTDAAGRFALPGLQLAAGQYRIRLHGDATPAIRLLSATPGGKPVAGQEAEPNNHADRANLIPQSNGEYTVEGTFLTDRDHDFFRIQLPPSRADDHWKLSLEIPPGQAASVCLKNHQGDTLQCKYRLQQPLMPDLYLTEDAYLIEVKDGKKGSRYRLVLKPQSETREQWESEPNDNWQRAAALGTNRLIKAALTGYDTDTFRFEVPEAGFNWRVQAMGPGLESLAILDGSGTTRQIIRGTQSTRQLRLNRLNLAAGTHYVQVKGKNVEKYRVRVLSTGRIDPQSETEPNDNKTLALPLPWQTTRRSVLNAPADVDYYFFRLGAEQRVELRLNPELPIENALVRLEGAVTETLKPDANGHYLLKKKLPAGKYTLKVRGSPPAPIDYTVSVHPLPYFVDENNANNCQQSAAAPSAQPQIDKTEEANTGNTTSDCVPKTPLPLRAQVTLENASVAAFQPYGQRLNGHLQVENSGTQPLRVQLQTALSEDQWRMTGLPERVELAAGQKKQLPFRLLVPADVPALSAARLYFQLANPAFAPATAAAEVKVSADAPLRHPRWDWGLPKKLLGGFNVAAKAHGGQVLPLAEGDKNRQHEQLIDGIAEVGRGFIFRRQGNQLPAITIDLAGEQPVPVAGFVLDPRGKSGPRRTPLTFAVDLSSDGVNFTPALEAELSPEARPQGFVLDKATPARFARLRIVNKKGRKTTGRIALGEFAVIAQPGWEPGNGHGLNLADPELGGFVAWSHPALSNHRDVAILTEKKDIRDILPPKGKPIEWVVGFNKTRTALIRGLEGVIAEQKGQNKPLEEFQVFVSEHSPVGPWQAIGQWNLRTNPRVDFSQPVWARYVRFLSTQTIEPRHWVRPPETLRIFEQPVGKGYLSILGEWGQGEEKAIREASQGIRLPSTDTGLSKTATTLVPDQPVTGQVQLGQHEAHYRIQVPPGKNTLLLGLQGDPTVRVVLSVHDSSGEKLPLRKENQDLNIQQFSARVSPGQQLQITVREPPRSVAFVWDDSGSMAEFRNSVYRAVTEYARGVRPGQDEANLLVFGGDYLLKDWTGSSRELLTALNEYPRNRNSSNAEDALKRATRGLAGRDGTRAIVLITDAEFPRDDNGLWALFNQVRPRIFTLHVGGNPGIPRQLMRLCPTVNNGHLAIINDTDDMDLAFERARARLRQPAAYTLQAGFDQRQDPGPARLSVLPAKQSSGTGHGNGAVELILDASGSMLQRLNGKRRIDIAKDVLSQAIDSLPGGTPVALRVFGHRRPNACDSALVSPPKALDKEKMKQQIGAITARNLAKTPIADSLAQVADDLKGIGGKKAVVLVTDGEETCDGDPAEVLDQLQKKGFDIRLNIVGFAIGDADLKEKFNQWAELAGGRYFDASNSAQLAQSVQAALRVPYSVFDQHGERVASGTVGGEPVSLPEGIYRIKVDTQPPRVFESVELTGGQQKNVRL